MKSKLSIKRIVSMALLDIVIIVACAYIAMLTRYAPEIPEHAVTETTEGLPRLLLSYIAVFGVFGMYKVRWREMSMQLLFRQTLGCIVGLGVVFLWEELLDLSLSRRYYLLIAFAFIICGICGSRLIMKIIRDVTAGRLGDQREKNCRMTISEAENGTVSLSVNDEHICGDENDIEHIVSEMSVTEIVICLSSADVDYMNRIADICLDTGCSVKRI